MRLLLFTENTHKGGLDTFLVSLILAWPKRDDQFLVLTNARHPGLGELVVRLKGRAEVVAHGAPAYVDFLLGASLRFQWMRQLLSPLLRAIYLLRGTRSLAGVFESRAADRLMIVSGGYPGGDSCLAAALAWNRRGGRQPLVFNVHNLARRAPSWNWPARFFAGWMDRRISSAASSVVAVSEACARSLKLRGVLWENALVTYIHNGISLDADGTSNARQAREAVRLASGFETGAPLCIMLATYERRKGHEFLLDVFLLVLSRVPDARLLICGFGTDAERSRLQAQIANRGLTGKVRLEGFRDDAMQLLLGADLLAVPSQSFESFGLTCVEAMARRVPVIATSIGGLAEVLADGDGGYLLAPDDVAGFAACMISLLGDPELRRAQGEKGRRRVERLFQDRRMAMQYADLLIEGKLPFHGQINRAGK